VNDAMPLPLKASIFTSLAQYRPVINISIVTSYWRGQSIFFFPSSEVGMLCNEREASWTILGYSQIIFMKNYNQKDLIIILRFYTNMLGFNFFLI
jgi:hypothetical protein